MNIEDLKVYDFSNLAVQDKWILSKLNKVISKVTKNMESYEFNNAGGELYNFIWSDFCDSYIEMSKFSLDSVSTQSTLCYAISAILKMLHPFMPYVTEEIYGKLPIRDEESIMISNYPEYNKKEIYNTNINNILEFITMFRNKKAELGIGNDYSVVVKIDNDNDREVVTNMLKLNDKIINDTSNNGIVVEYNGLEIDIIYDNSKNIQEENEKLLKEKEKLETSINRREKLLSNENYINRAPSEIVEQERNNLEKEKELLKNILNKFTN